MIKLFEHYRNGEKVYSRIIEPVCKKFNLTHMEFVIIMFLYNNPIYDTAADIVKYKRLTKSHVSNEIKKLTDRRLLTQVYDANNRKSIHLSLTEEAKEIAKIGREYQESFQEVSLKGFSDEEIDTLISYIERINNNIKDYK